MLLEFVFSSLRVSIFIDPIELPVSRTGFPFVNIKNTMFEAIKNNFGNNTETKDEKKIAELIRKNLEEKEEGKWNVVLGKDFGSHIVHKSRRYGYFQIGELNILIWQS